MIKRNKDKLKYNFRSNFALITTLILLIGITSILSNKKRKKQGCNLQIQAPFENKIGILRDSLSQNYVVYSRFKIINACISAKGVSNLILIHNKDSIIYRLDLPEELPISIDHSGNKLVYCNNGTLDSFEYDFPYKILCSPFNCYERND